MIEYKVLHSVNTFVHTYTFILFYIGMYTYVQKYICKHDCVSTANSKKLFSNEAAIVNYFQTTIVPCACSCSVCICAINIIPIDERNSFLNFMLHVPLVLCVCVSCLISSEMTSLTRLCHIYINAIVQGRLQTTGWNDWGESTIIVLLNYGGRILTSFMCHFDVHYMHIRFRLELST